MQLLRRRRWQLLFFLMSVTIFGASYLKVTAATSSQPSEQGESSEDQRRATARKTTSDFLADPHNRQAPVKALLSFQQGLKVPVALAQLKRLAPDVTPFVITSYIFDEMGDRHTFGVIIHPGENPEAKVNQYVHGLVQQTRERAAAMLRCTGPQRNNDQQRGNNQESETECEAPAEHVKPNLIAQTRLDAGRAFVAGVVIEAPAQTIEQLLSQTDVVAAVEIVHGDRVFVSPITPTEGGN